MTLLAIRPATPARWADLAALFATSPVMRGCWCMWPRTPRERFEFGSANKARLRVIVDGGTVPGLLAYADGVAVGWCSVGPRDHYARFVDVGGESDRWLLACLFISAGHRGRRVGTALVEAAVAHAVAHGARRLEALPRGWRPDDDPATMHAVLRLFRRTGFTETVQGAPVRLCKDLAE